MSVRQTEIRDLDQHILGEILIHADNYSAIARTSKYFRKIINQTLLLKFMSNPSTRSFVCTAPGFTDQERVQTCVWKLKEFCSNRFLTPKNQLNPIILSGVVEKCKSMNTLILRIKTASTPEIKNQLVIEFVIDNLKESMVSRGFSQECIRRSIERTKRDLQKDLIAHVCDFSNEDNAINLSEFASMINMFSNLMTLLSSMANNVDETGCDDIEAVKIVLNSEPISIDILCQAIQQAIEFKNEIILTTLLLPLLHDSDIPTPYLEKLIMTAAESKNSELTEYLMGRLPKISPTLYLNVERWMPTMRSRINPPNNSCIVC